MEEAELNVQPMGLIKLSEIHVNISLFSNVKNFILKVCQIGHT